MDLQSTLRRSTVALAGTSLCLALASGVAAAVPAKGGPQRVEGTLTWTVLTTTVVDEAAVYSEKTTTREEYSLEIEAVRDPRNKRKYAFARTKMPYTYKYSLTSVLNTFTSGQQDCELTTQDDADGAWFVRVSSSLFGKSNSIVRKIDKGTKGISIRASMPAQGISTTTQKGFGANPCADGEWTEAVSVIGDTGIPDSRRVCLPRGLQRPQRATSDALYGRYIAAERRFDFTCSLTSDDKGGSITELTVQGVLEYKR